MIKTKTRTKQKPVPVIDLGGEYLSIKKKIDAAVTRVLASGSYILGEETKRFEEELARYCEASFAVGVNSGTDAILLALRALDIGPGDEVIVPAMTFIATAEPVVMLGAKPVFVDIDPQTYTIDPRQVEESLSEHTKAIIAVHLYGQPADMEALADIANANQIPLIEDMAQAIGSGFSGKRVGGIGTLACVSFFPTKNLGAYGDGGAVLTSDDTLAFRLRILRNHGAKVKYDHEELGYNTRLDEVQSAILRIKLDYLDRWNLSRIKLAHEYSRQLSKLPVHTPTCASNRTHVYHLYSVRTAKRDELRAYLQEQGIQTGMHYPKPLHLQTAFKSLGGKPGDHPHSERLAKETVSLPLYPQLTKPALHRVVETVESFFKAHS